MRDKVLNAVAPATPAEAAAAGMPKNWRDGLAFLADQFAVVLMSLNAKIDNQANQVEQAAKARVDMEAAFRKDLQAFGALFDPLDAGVKAVAAQVEALADATKQGIDQARADAGEHARELGQRIADRDTVFDALSVRVDVLAEGVTAAAAVAGITTQSIADRARELGQRIDQTRGDFTDALAARADAFDEHLLGVGRRLDALASDVSDIADAATEETSRVSQRVGEVAAQVELIPVQLAELVARSVDDVDTRRVADREALETVLVETGGRINAVEASVIQVEHGIEQHAAELDGAGKLITTMAEALATVDRLAVRAVEDVAAVGARLDTVAEQFRKEVSEARGSMADMVGVAVEEFTAVRESVAAEVERNQQLASHVTIALGTVPAGFMIDQGGNLIRTDRSGEAVPIGRVAARDGADAPEIVAAKVEGGRLVFTRSDRTEFSCVLPIDPPAPVESVVVEPPKPQTEAEKIAEMVALRASGWKYSAIAAKFGISERTAARTIKAALDAKTDKPKT